jgi:hypothetical protein
MINNCGYQEVTLPTTSTRVPRTESTTPTKALETEIATDHPTSIIAITTSINLPGHWPNNYIVIYLVSIFLFSLLGLLVGWTIAKKQKMKKNKPEEGHVEYINSGSEGVYESLENVTTREEPADLDPMYANADRGCLGNNTFNENIYEAVEDEIIGEPSQSNQRHEPVDVDSLYAKVDKSRKHDDCTNEDIYESLKDDEIEEPEDVDSLYATVDRSRKLPKLPSHSQMRRN